MSDEPVWPGRDAGTVRIGGVGAARGERRHGRLWVTGYPPDLMPDLLLVVGARPGPVLAVVAGVHGDEGAAVAAALRLARGARPETMAGSLVVLPVANVPGFRDRRAVVNPLDGQDLDRLFPGAPRGGPSVRLAHALVDQLALAVDAVVDLHGGGHGERLTPFTLVPESEAAPPAALERSLALARAAALGPLVRAPLVGSLATAMLARGLPAVRLAAGSLGLAEREAVTALVRGVRRLMAALATAPGPSPSRRERPPLALTRVLAPADGYWRPLTLPTDRIGACAQLGRLTRRGDGGVRATAEAVRSPVGGTVLMIQADISARAGAPLALLATPAPAAARADRNALAPGGGLG